MRRDVERARLDEKRFARARDSEDGEEVELSGDDISEDEDDVQRTVPATGETRSLGTYRVAASQLI